MSFDPELFPDVADALGIDSPAIVEKDAYAVELLRLLTQVQSEHFELIFAGGTSLAKAHRNIYRMSEDIDIKLVARKGATVAMSRTALKGARRAVLANIEQIINCSEHLSLALEGGVLKRNENRYAEFTVTYPRTQRGISALRPNLKLDVTASELFEDPVACSVSSLYAEVLQYPPEVASFPVVSIRSTISEKTVALLRRTAQVDRDPSRKDDEMLVRHVYDLHMATSSGYDTEALRRLIHEVMRIDAEQFGRQHPQFLADPVAELYHGLNCLRTNPVHKERYERFIGPLVYHDSPVLWGEAVQTVTNLMHNLLPERTGRLDWRRR